jgi:O-antigen/teichoic acid export membrane protein
MRSLVRQLQRGDGIEGGIWSPFRSLLAAQVIGAVLGLVFWILAARLVDAHEVGVAAAAISAQTLLGLVTVLGIGTVLISDLPLHDPRRQRQLIQRGLLVVTVSSALVGGLLVGLSPLFTANLREALDDPIGAVAFVVGVAAAAWAMVTDEAALGVKKSAVQVQRNLLASSLRFPVTAGLLTLGLTDAHVLQVCWVLPLVVSVPFALWRLRLPRRAPGSGPMPSLRADVTTFGGHALRNYALSLSLASASQMVPVVAGLALTSVHNAEFAIAWLMATFVFLPPYLLAIALFAHGANVPTEEFRKSMEKTLPASLLLSALLCVGAWVLGEPVLLIFGGDYATESWKILALLVPAGLWMCFKDHLVALWRSQRRYGLATKLAASALVIEVAGATIGAILGGAVGLCIGWLVAMAVEAVLSTPWLREAFGGLRWQNPLTLRPRTEAGRTSPTVVGAVALVALIVTVGIWSSLRGSEAPGTPSGPEDPISSVGSPGSTGSPSGEDDECAPTPQRPGPAIDLGIQASRGDQRPANLSAAQVRTLVGQAADAGASVISTSASFKAIKPIQSGPYRFDNLDRVVDSAAAAGLDVKLRMTWTPDWALDEPPVGARQAPRSEAELARWETFVRDVMQHVDGKVDYVEVWTEPNSQRYWPTGPDPVEFARLLDVSSRAIHDVAPDAMVIAGGLRGNDVGFLEAMYDAFETIGLADTPFDMLGVEPFNGGADPETYDEGNVYSVDPFGEVDGNFLGFETLRDVMVEHGDDDLAIYITLFGYSTEGDEDRPGVDDATRAAYLTSALELATCRPYIGAFSWYAFHPNPWDPPSWTLVDAKGEESLTYDALVAWSDRASE